MYRHEYEVKYWCGGMLQSWCGLITAYMCRPRIRLAGNASAAVRKSPIDGITFTAIPQNVPSARIVQPITVALTHFDFTWKLNILSEITRNIKLLYEYTLEDSMPNKVLIYNIKLLISIKEIRSFHSSNLIYTEKHHIFIKKNIFTKLRNMKINISL